MEIPIKGRDIVAKLEDGRTVYIYRCNCTNESCMEWRCSVTGSAMMLSSDIASWHYHNNQ